MIKKLKAEISKLITLLDQQDKKDIILKVTE